MRRSALCLVAGALLLSGCGGSDPDESAEPVVTATTTVLVPTTTVAGGPTSVVAPPTTPPGPPASAAPPPTVALEPTVDLCTEALAVAGDVELTFEEAASRLDGLAARAVDPALADELRGLAAGFRSGSAPAHDGLDALCA